MASRLGEIFSSVYVKSIYNISSTLLSIASFLVFIVCFRLSLSLLTLMSKTMAELPNISVSLKLMLVERVVLLCMSASPLRLAGDFHLVYENDVYCV